MQSLLDLLSSEPQQSNPGAGTTVRAGREEILMFNNSVKYRMKDCKSSSTLEGMGRFVQFQSVLP